MSYLERWFAGLDSDPANFSPALLRIQSSPPHPMRRAVLQAVIILLTALLVWAIFGRLDIVAVAEGKLVPETYLKIVQPSDSGIVKEILVKEGEAVEAGQVLMRMDALMTDADAKALRAELLRKQLALRRIDAELSNSPFMLNEQDPLELAKETQAQYKANRAALQAALAEEQTRLVKAHEELAAATRVREKLVEVLPHYQQQEAAFDKLAKGGFGGSLIASDKRRERIEKEAEVNTQEHLIKSASASISQSEKKLVQLESDYRRQLYTERNEAQGAAEKLSQEVAKQTHKQNLLELRAPQDGVVKDLATHTIGTVVQPGTVMLTLVPKDEMLLAEVWISNEDIGFVHPGQSVKVKLAAFPFQKYGMAEGRVKYVGADAQDNDTQEASIQRDKRSQFMAYKALVALESMQLERNGRKLQLSAGMQASAEVLLGNQTVMEYLMSPVRGAFHEAARER